MIREVNEFEYFNYVAGQPYNLVVSLRIKGPLTIELLKCVFRKLQTRHPLLTARIDERENGIPLLTSENVGEIPIEIVTRETDALTNKEFQKQLITPFDLSVRELPLLRATWLTAEQNSDLILCCQHIITDGMSMAFLVRDLIHILNNPNIEVEVLDTPTKDIDLIPAKVRRSFVTKPQVAKRWLVYLKILQAILFKRKKKEIEDSKTRKHQDLQIHSWVFTETQTKEFLQKCKTRGISVHSALCTAFLADIPGINHFVDLRNRLNYPIGESFGLYVGGSFFTAKYRKRKDFWQNCHRYQRKLIWNLQDRKIYRSYRLMNKSLPIPLFNNLGRAFTDLAITESPFAITNLRSLDKLGVTFDSNEFSVGSFNAAVSSTFNAMTVLVFTIRKKMHFHFHYMESIHEIDRVKQISENAIARLLES